MSQDPVQNVSRLKHFIEQIFNGDPLSMALQSIAGAIGALLSAWSKVNPFVGIYIGLVVVDTILGVRLAKRQGKPFSWSHLLWGPGQKILFTAVILLGAQFMERFVPGEFLAFGMAAYMCAVLFLEAVSKYDTISGTNVLAWVRDRLSTATKPKDP